jgi:hypothetical protein
MAIDLSPRHVPPLHGFLPVLLLTIVGLLVSCGASTSQPARRTPSPTKQLKGTITEYPIPTAPSGSPPGLMATSGLPREGATRSDASPPAGTSRSSLSRRPGAASLGSPPDPMATSGLRKQAATRSGASCEVYDQPHHVDAGVSPGAHFSATGWQSTFRCVKLEHGVRPWTCFSPWRGSYTLSGKR